MDRRRSGSVAPLLLVLAATAGAQEASGFAEVRGVAQVGVDGVPYNLIERFRPTFDAPLAERITLSTTVEVEWVQGRQLQQELQRTLEDSDLGPLLALAGCAWPEVRRNEDWLRVERLTLDVYLPQVDLRIGRQAVQWGSALLINPTDPFPQVLFVEPWRFRAGVDAVRATIPIERHQLQLFAGADETFTAPRLAARGTLRVAGVDVSAVGAHRGETDEELLGIDLRGTLGVGFWAEAAAHLPQGGDPWEELAVGLDYSFPVLENLFVAGQYYRLGRNPSQGGGAGAVGGLAASIVPPVCEVPDGTDPLAALGLDPDAAVDPYASPFSGRDYALAVVRLGVVEELSTNLSALQNLGDGTGVLIPQVTVLPTGFLEVALVAQLPYRAWGEGGEFRPDPRDLRLRIAPSPLLPPVRVALGGLVPEATLSLWTRATF